jgi:hypothetical protein
MRHPDIQTLDRVRRQAGPDGKWLSGITLEDAQAVLRMVATGDLIHVDQVPGYVLRGRKKAYGDALVQSLRSAREAA